jgi:hypothetical protein
MGANLGAPRAIMVSPLGWSATHWRAQAGVKRRLRTHAATAAGVDELYCLATVLL